MKIPAITRWRRLLYAMLVYTTAYTSAANASVIVQLKIVDGEGAVYQTGSHAARGLTVLVTDETGKPVSNAAVSFKLPDEGSSGVFGSGLRTQVVTTGADGRATVLGMQWNKTPGPVEIHITAVKDQARAGLISTIYLNDTASPKAGGEGTFTTHKSHSKWLLIGAIAGGAAAAGLALGRSHSTTAPTSLSISTSIGTPSIIVGHP